MNAIAFAEMMAKLATHPYGIRAGGWTLRELAEHSGLHYKSVCEWVGALHDRGVVRIADWAPDVVGRSTLQCFALADGRPDVPKPAPMTRAQISARYREKMRGVRGQKAPREELPRLSESRRDRALRNLGKLWAQGVQA